jgi:hypothetical protein
MGYLQQEMIEEKVMNDEVMKWRRLAEDAQRDLHIVTSFAWDFVVTAQAELDCDKIRSAAHYACESTGYNMATIAEVLERLDLCDPEHCKRDYEVTLTIPVEVTVTVEATDEESALEAAVEMVQYEGIDSYHMEYDAERNDDYYVREV